MHGKHLIWQMAQFDWLLTRQDFPVLHAHGQYAIFTGLPPTRLRREPPSFKQSKKGLKVVQNHKNEENQQKIRKRYIKNV